MNVWSKLLTALRGGANEVGEAMVDSQALRILDQEIRDADLELRKSKEALAEIMAKQKLAADRAEKSAAKVAEYEQYALKALEAGNEVLAQEVAVKIANLEVEVAGEREQAEGYAASVAQLRKAVSQAEANIKRLKQQVDTVKATESVQKAQMAVAQRYGGSQAKLHTAVESLERIKQQQAERAAKMEAAAELAEAANIDDSLETKLRAAGIKADNASAESVLARLKEKAKS
ncbi:PspA/IM30 family protein [Pseudomonas sp. GOM6]|uniref:PspA/IM30 family protein n=1 Tax=Pseudomonas sp. GOM6 TaxID=3036944 RepID=UPI00240956E3|nr:PspA/IM30 family protein [Pseudomonas sp. GOM6]MDG1580096.1 PspA/IM30 family protein [Pseudomonas sp. GOM6]